MRKKDYFCKKGLSPVIASVLLILVVIILAIMIFLWARAFVDDQAGGSELSVNKICSSVNFNAILDNNGSVLEIVNKGNIDINAFEIKKYFGGDSEIIKINMTVLAGKSIRQEVNLGDISLSDKIEICPAINKTSSKKLFICYDDPIPLLEVALINCTPEICGNGIDDDCDGEVDEGCGPGDVDGCTDQDGDGYPGTDVGTSPPVNNGVNGQPEDYISYYQFEERRTGETTYQDIYTPENVVCQNPDFAVPGSTIMTNYYSGYTGYDSYGVHVDSITSEPFFRFYIPPGNVQTSLTIWFPNHYKYVTVARLGLPPQENYPTGHSGEDFAPMYDRGMSTGTSLASLRDQDLIRINHGGMTNVLAFWSDNSNGEWLYVKLLRFEPYNPLAITSMSFMVSMDLTEYTNWYNNFGCWGADGDPLPLLGSCDGTCDTTDPNFDCDDTNSSVHPNATEICGNGIDEDCDGVVDEGCG
ncbi:putative metal-binding motif-containing protein [Candidatus Pacearchaeota archaeon]|nr:putative metal-binding motif-containing protein [Candidatus Pacearchaeota archaeon]